MPAAVVYTKRRRRKHVCTRFYERVLVSPRGVHAAVTWPSPLRVTGRDGTNTRCCSVRIPLVGGRGRSLSLARARGFVPMHIEIWAPCWSVIRE